MQIPQGRVGRILLHQVVEAVDQPPDGGNAAHQGEGRLGRGVEGFGAHGSSFCCVKKGPP